VGSLVITQKNFIEILKKYNFYFKRQVASHQQWEGIVEGKRRLVGVDVNYQEYSRDLLASMIRQSGIPKKVFRQ
jgi:predicted RNA binding protein YcfA (HicA-like mRNA interferase family)